MRLEFLRPGGRISAARWVRLAILCSLFSAACSSGPSSSEFGPGLGAGDLAKAAEAAAEGEPAPDEPLPRPARFSGPLAQSHEAALEALGPRRPDSPADDAARSYLTREFVSAGARVWEAREGGSRHLMAELEGRSPDIMMLVAPYSLIEPDAWVGDSGAALLLELARNLGRERRLYTIRFALAETRAADPGRGAPQIETAAVARGRVLRAASSLSRALAAAEFESRSVLRGVIAFDTTSRPDLRFARDLRSHPIYREIFWSAAKQLGFTDLFPADAGWSSPKSLQLGLEAAADGKILALVDESWTRPERMTPPNQTRSARTLERSGQVTLEALDRLMQRFARIDGFGRAEQPERSPEAVPPQPVTSSSSKLPNI